MLDRGIVPELEIFDFGMVNFVHVLQQQGPAARPGRRPTCSSATSPACRPRSPRWAWPSTGCLDGTIWSGAGLGDFGLPVQAHSIAAGGGVRVGLEDGIWFDRGRTRLATNPMLVERVHELLALHDRPMMTPARAPRPPEADDRPRRGTDPAGRRTRPRPIREAVSRVLRDGPWILGGRRSVASRSLRAVRRPAGTRSAWATGPTRWPSPSPRSGCSAGAGVLVAANEGGYAATAARMVGLVPVVMDVDASTMGPTVETAAGRAPRRRRGPRRHPPARRRRADLAALDAWRRGAGLALVEDCAQAHGLRVAGEHVGCTGGRRHLQLLPDQEPRRRRRRRRSSCFADAVGRRPGHARCGSTAGASASASTSPGGRNTRLDPLQAAVLSRAAALPRRPQRTAPGDRRAVRRCAGYRCAPARRPRLDGRPPRRRRHRAARRPHRPPERRQVSTPRCTTRTSSARCPASASHGAATPVAAGLRDDGSSACRASPS